jgi:type II secretory ATPase GspE/PulE/Tfp pilus assembly ATPase PilB-like protein
MTGFLPWTKGGQQGPDSTDEQFLPIVDFAPDQGPASGDAAARVAAARALPGFDEARRLIVEAIAFRADRLMLETTSESTAWFDVDGVRLKPRCAEQGVPQGGQWKESEPLSRDAGMAVAQVLRTLSGLADSSLQQEGVFGLTIDRVPCLGHFAATRSTQGERITVQFMTKNRFPVTLQDAGITESMVGRLAKLVDQDHGLLLLSSPPGQGLTTSLDLLVEASDRFLRDFVAITSRDRPGREIVNLATMPYGHKDAPTAVELLKTAMTKNVGVIVAPDVRDKDFVVELVKMAATKAMVLISIKAADASEAVARVMKCGVDPKAFGSAFRGSLSQRLVRRLCPRCRVQVEPPAAFRPGAQGPGEQVAHVFTAARHGCQLCCGVGYRGRIGVFELAAGDTLRRVVASGGGSERLRQAALKDGMQPLRHAGLQLVAEGTTSLEEIERVLSPIIAEKESQSARA